MTDWTLPEALIVCHIYAIRERNKEKAKQLANCALGMLDRSRGSLNKKIANIQYVDSDGREGLENGGKIDKQAWAIYSDYSEYDRQVLESAIMSCSPEIKDLLLKADDAPIRGEDVIKECKVRVGQAQLRAKCLELAGGKCMVTGIHCPELLVASHIKPWRDCSKDEKTDARNVLCLSPFYDALFDKHLMTVYPDMSIRYSPKLRDSMGEQEYSRFIAPYDRIEVNELNRPDEKYLRIHNEEFEKNLRRGKDGRVRPSSRIRVRKLFADTRHDRVPIALQLALPDHYDCPAHLAELSLVALVSRHIGGELVLPVLAVVLGYGEVAMGAAVPEAAVDEYRDFAPRIADVRPSRDLPLESVPGIPCIPEGSAEGEFGPSVFPFVRLHRSCRVFVERFAVVFHRSGSTAGIISGQRF